LELHTPPEFAGFPAFANSYVYVGAVNYSESNPGVKEGIVYALNASTGTKIWSHLIGNFSSDGPNFVPVVTGSIVYIGAGNKTYALDAATGDEKWAFTDQYSVGTPLFFNPYVYVTSGANVYCLDASTGVVKWTYTIESEATSPIIADGNVYVGSAGAYLSIYNNAYALDAYTGKKIWNYTIEGNPGYFTLAEGIVYVGSYKPDAAIGSPDADGAVYALKPITVTSLPLLSTLVVIAVVVVTVILVVVFLTYRIRRKGADKSAAQHVASVALVAKSLMKIDWEISEVASLIVVLHNLNSSYPYISSVNKWN
jgi:outer membrane protein assembly factor BamB